MLKLILKKISDNDLLKALKITISILLPFIFLKDLDDGFRIMFAISTGALLTSPVDIPSSMKHKIVGMTIGSLITPIITFIIGITVDTPIVFYPIFVIIAFLSTIISMYGQRALQLSFTALLAMSLAFVRDFNDINLLIQDCLCLFIGGVLYMMVSLSIHFIKPKLYINIVVSNCLKKTGEYLELRAKLWSEDTNRDDIIEKQLAVQVKLNELHENIREYVIYNKLYESNSNNNRKLLMNLVLLVDIMEFASANVFDHNLIFKLYKNREDLISDYQKIAFDLATTLHALSYHIISGKRYHSPVTLTTDFLKLKEKFNHYNKVNHLKNDDEQVIVFNNVLTYVEKQIQLVKGIERIYKGRVNADELRGKYKDLEKFLTPQHYNLSILKENLNLSSSYFRYAVRASFAMLMGYILGNILPLQNEYWILLTIAVIMRPGYGLTYELTKNRILGTIIGGVIAFGILYFMSSETDILIAISIISMIIGYWASYTLYKIGVIFITIYVILVFGLIQDELNFQEVFIHRISDTVIGGCIVFAANYMIFPSWEFSKIKNHIKKSIKSNIHYIEEIKKYYQEKGEPTTAYKLARKQAYIELGNLMASFQRMIQEPKSKQKNRTELYKMIILNQSLVSSAASIGTYIQSRQTPQPSKAMHLAMNKIVENLKSALDTLNKNTQNIPSTKQNIEMSFSLLKSMREEELHSIENEKIKQQKMEESKLIIDQLIWITELSERIMKVSISMK